MKAHVEEEQLSSAKKEGMQRSEKRGDGWIVTGGIGRNAPVECFHSLPDGAGVQALLAARSFGVRPSQDSQVLPTDRAPRRAEVDTRRPGGRTSL